YYKPEVVIVDQEMPEMNGIETLRAVREEFPAVQVIMFTGATEQSARLTIEALQLGAADFCMKPVTKAPEELREFIRTKLVATVLASVSRKPKTVGYIGPRINVNRGAYRVAGIGISTGGPAALKQLFQKLPGNIDGSLLIAQHMPALFTPSLA